MINVASGLDDHLTALVYSVMHGIDRCKPVSVLLALQMHLSIKGCFM